ADRTVGAAVAVVVRPSGTGRAVAVAVAARRRSPRRGARVRFDVLGRCLIDVLDLPSSSTGVRPRRGGPAPDRVPGSEDGPAAHVRREAGWLGSVPPRIAILLCRTAQQSVDFLHQLARTLLARCGAVKGRRWRAEGRPRSVPPGGLGSGHGISADL